jgi:hypothetical protein
MSRRWLLFLVCLGCTLPFLGQVTYAGLEIRVEEAATRTYLKEPLITYPDDSNDHISLFVSETVKQQFFTPRVREYFPETLLRQPQLTTAKKGRAQTRLQTGRHITTRRMSVVASTEDGEIGTAETEIRALQSFFADFIRRAFLPKAIRSRHPEGSRRTGNFCGATGI